MIGQTLGHCRILEQIGAGRMGVVRRVHNERLDRDVALKVSPAGTFPVEVAGERFRDEAAELSKLDHSDLATVHHFDRQDGTEFLVMKFVSYVALGDRLTSGPHQEEEILRLATQLAEGPTAMRMQGIAHCDIKPAISIDGERRTGGASSGQELAVRSVR